MPLYTCPKGHQFAAKAVGLNAEAVAGLCPNHPCASDPLTALKNLESHMLASRHLVSELFDEGGPLYKLYMQVLDTKLHDSAALKREFERSSQATREGVVLTYLAQAIRNDGANKIWGFLEKDPNIIVVITLVIWNGKAHFVVGLNAHDASYGHLDMFKAAIPDNIAGIPVIIVTDQQPPHPSCVKKRLAHFENEVSAWSWHGEQKVLKYIKQQMGLDARLTVTCLGIAHVAGPCTEQTAGRGTNHCNAYLARKFAKDEGQLKIGGNVTHTVSAYWYASMQPSWAASLLKLG